ncbi:unnamed protein product [Cuscuta campestris]|uniref:Reverse transcriptase domain-containing protein n=1 Tax=Cuscuta campestris TaxID=132261 RepID=A0A484N4C3_9ASTE|nr:unnamed protein product [Cuscuta campestris]
MAGGVKQGDPLSPLLFIIGLEGLSRLLISHHHSGYLSPFNVGRVPNPSHLAYADDLVIFTNGRVRNLLRLSNSISSFLQASGQRVNLLKSKFYTYSSSSPQALSAKERALKIQHDRNHLNYLGVPICKGILRKEDCGFLIEHFDRLLSSWYNKSLNSMGRLTLIKYTLSSIPLHLMYVHKLPKSISSNLMKRMANFLWGFREGKSKHHWVSWTKICQPTESGGLWIKHLDNIQEACALKLWWKINNNSDGGMGNFLSARPFQLPSIATA